PLATQLSQSRRVRHLGHQEEPVKSERIVRTPRGVWLSIILSACGGVEAPPQSSVDDAVEAEADFDPAAAAEINIRRSLVVGNVNILDQRFSMRRILDQLARQLQTDS